MHGLYLAFRHFYLFKHNAQFAVVVQPACRFGARYFPMMRLLAGSRS